MEELGFDQRIEAVRRFNRFHTRRIGVLHEHLLHSRFSLTEARVVWELAHRERTTATELSAELGLDAGYLSRILRRLHRAELVARTPSEDDRRRVVLSLTDAGREAFAEINAASRREIGAMLDELPAADQLRLVAAMATVEHVLGAGAEHRVPYILRLPHAGDMGWVIQAHGAQYAREYGWNEEFEALVAGIVADFLNDNDPRRERCWIAEKDGENVGSVFLVEKSRTVAQLRLLLVTPKARGLGIGGRLVDECIRFARDAGYREMTLWTNDVLHAARRIYERRGFRLVKEEPHHSFGADLVGQYWQVKL